MVHGCTHDTLQESLTLRKSLEIEHPDPIAARMMAVIYVVVCVWRSYVECSCVQRFCVQRP